MITTEFLPICDNLFNVISLAAYFCDCVFDIVLGYTLLERGRIKFFIAVVLIISGSLIVSQVVSLKWYLNRRAVNKSAITVTQETTVAEPSTPPISKISKYVVIGLHFCQLGVFWRYAKLFVPVDLRYVKNEVRDLCILRLIHAFCEAAPMLLIQCYILMTLQANEDNNLNPIKIKTLGGQLSTHLVQQSTIVHQYQQKTFKDLNIISAFLSMFSVCWALASFSKNVRVHNVHRLVLTWLGVIFQFLWRLGTVTSRILSLTAYASVYHRWIFLVLILHWISMFLWLISPKNAFHGERISCLKKMLLSSLMAFIYIFAYINLQEMNHKQKMTIFYIVMFLENCLLVSLWMVGIWPDRADDWYLVPVYVLLFFFGGILIMIVYYKYFHIRRLGYETESSLTKCTPFSNNCTCNGLNMYPDSITFHQKKERGLYEDHCDGEVNGKNHHHAPTNENLKGIFNCRFSNSNNATKRKKKKPTSFIPPPILNIPGNINALSLNSRLNEKSEKIVQPQISNDVSGPTSIPFWRQPLPRSIAGGSSETEGSVASSRINIQLKLQEKKQKQLAELKIIEEEIKQGKLGRQKLAMESCENDECGKVSLLRQPAPRAKKHMDIETIDFRRNSSESDAGNINVLLSQLKQNNENVVYNNFSPNSGSPAAALAKFPYEMPTNINPNDICNNIKQQSASSTSTTSENENNSLNQSRKKLLHPNIGSNLNVRASPSCLYDPRQSAYNSLEGKNKTDTNRSSNSKNDPNGSIEKDRMIKRQLKRGNTPEILLAPNHLDSSAHFYQHLKSGVLSVPYRNLDCDGASGYIEEYRTGNGFERAIEMDDEADDSQNAPSDIDSQMSLPRSYTLPREFKFNRQGRKVSKNEHFFASTNSSDGDVDSCDDNEYENDEDKISISQRMRNRRTNNLNKNRLHSNSPYNNISPNITTQKQYQHVYNLRAGNIKVNNLDLINGIDNRYDKQETSSRHSRNLRMNRHETKL